MDRDQLNQLRSKRIGGEPEDENDRFLRCPECGLMFDMRLLGVALDHDPPGYEPFPLDS
jgi:hypothetical protein